MPALAETQDWLRAAIGGSAAAAPPPGLYGGRAPQARLAIYRRNHAVSLLRALLAKFPATHWLLGDALFREAAGDFVRAHPPQSPSLAEYADGFPAFLAAHPALAAIPYAGDLATLDWHLGLVAVAADPPPVAIAALAALAAERLPDVRLRLMPGLRRAELAWPADDLLRLFLAEAAPDRIDFHPGRIFVELRGSRGAYSVGRLGEAEHRFQAALADGSSLGAAAEAALAGAADFDPGAAVAAAFDRGLVAAVIHPAGERLP